MPPKTPRILVIAGSDSGGGAGIQADIKTITALGGYATTAITALTAQNTLGVQAVHPAPATFVAQQITSVLDDIGTDAVKLGMLHNAETMQAIAPILETLDVPIILDPVMVATSGDPLFEPEAIEIFRENILPLARILTPNIPEAKLLSGAVINTIEDMKDVGLSLSSDRTAVVMKGGHLDGDMLTNIVVEQGEVAELNSPRIKSTNTHGTGCTLASALATLTARGQSLTEATHNAQRLISAAIDLAPGFGNGHGPMDHHVFFRENDK